MTETFTPQTTDQVVEALRWAGSEQAALEIVGGGSKRAFGRPGDAENRLDLAAIGGIVLYEPKELVMSAKPSTPLAEIEAAMAENRQQLAFEPADLGPLLGAGEAAAGTGGTIGGAIACNLSGPRRIKAGAARDHILGFQAINGRGETFKSGGRMFKNVTGFDLSKLMTGSFGTLSVFTELTFKVLPAAEETATVLILGADAATAVAAMTAALHSPNEVSAAAYLPADVAAGSAVTDVAAAGRPMTALRLEGFGPSVDYRRTALRRLLADCGELRDLGSEESGTLWREIRDAAYFAADRDPQIWRISVPPAEGAGIAEALLASCGGRVFLDWGGGLIWLAAPPRPDAGHEDVRGAIAACGGHATLIRAEPEVRASVPVFQPQPCPLARVTAQVKESFDPHRVLNPGRMYAGV